MTEGQQKQLDEIKEMMILRQKAYEANHQWAKAKAIGLMRQDIIERLEHIWVCGYD